MFFNNIWSDPHQLIYLYDLPRDYTTSTAIAEVYREKTGFELDIKPQIKRDVNKFFYTAIIKVHDSYKYKQAVEKMRYFSLKGKQCRALPFDKDFLGNGKEKYAPHNVFVRNIPRDASLEELDSLFRQFGPIKSLKVSITQSHEQKGYGFVCFEQMESAQKCIEVQGQHETNKALPFQLKNTRDVQKAFNNVYVRGFPKEFTEEDLFKLFRPFGEILSLKIIQNEKGPFAFVCYGQKDSKDVHYGFQCAFNASEGLHEKHFDGFTLYVARAMKKYDRLLKLKIDMMQYYKNRKKMSLYVKNFPEEANEADLRGLFERYGELEHFRIMQTCQGDSNFRYALVSFQNNETAQKAKMELNRFNFMGRSLYVNCFQMKDIRRAEVEDCIDTSDFQNYIKHKTLITPETFMKPEVIAIIASMMQFIQPRFNQFSFNQRNNNNHNNGFRKNNFPKFNNFKHKFRNNDHEPPSFEPPQFYPPPPVQQSYNSQSFNPHVMPLPPVDKMALTEEEKEYLIKTNGMFFKLDPNNSNLREDVGCLVYDYVDKMVEKRYAPKITGMLIAQDLPQVKRFLSDLKVLKQQIHDALQIIKEYESNNPQDGDPVIEESPSLQ